ncbi:MAG TPA: hypothetical protein GX515_08765 [Firmicutes bacterium]|nr:hypothetical protein [Bacillota bacterium]
MKDSGLEKRKELVRETTPQYIPPQLRLTYEDYRRMSSGERYELVEV